MRLVVIESPFAGRGRTPLGRWFDGWCNRRYLSACMRKAIAEGNAPIASHALYTRYLNDRAPSQRSEGLRLGLAWARFADAVDAWTDRGESPGMFCAYLRHRHNAVPVAKRSLDARWAENWRVPWLVLRAWLRRKVWQ